MKAMEYFLYHNTKRADFQYPARTAEQARSPRKA